MQPGPLQRQSAQPPTGNPRRTWNPSQNGNGTAWTRRGPQKPTPPSPPNPAAAKNTPNHLHRQR